jgi:aminoglycoside phosphotransferase (APT) family kinase protein
VDYDALPTAEGLGLLGTLLGRSVAFVRRIEGGQSATTDVLVFDGGDQIVLRRHGPWSKGFDDAIAIREAAVLAAVRSAGVPAPPVVWFGRFGGRSAIVTELVDGEAVLDPASGAPWASRLAYTLAAIHAVNVDEALSRMLRDAPPSPVDIVLAPEPASHPDTQRLHALRKRLLPNRGQPTMLVHGDYWPGNTLWRDGHIVAVLDWEAAFRGDPAADVAYCATEMHLLGLHDAAERFVGAYREKTGSDLDSLDYWLVTALLRGISHPESFVESWRGLGHHDDIDAVATRQRGLVERHLGG